MNVAGEAFTDNPTTIQYGTCGKPGLQIQMSQRFLTEAAGTTSTERSKDLLRQWVHYRYGVFAEHGFAGDKMYPLYRSPPGVQESGRERVTSCAASLQGLAHLRTVNRTRSGTICSLDTDKLTGLPTKNDCIPYPDPTANNDLVSSLMSQILPTVGELCDKRNHDADAPNKQNALCGERSIGEVISTHYDFKNNNRYVLTLLALSILPPSMLSTEMCLLL